MASISSYLINGWQDLSSVVGGVALPLFIAILALKSNFAEIKSLKKWTFFCVAAWIPAIIVQSMFASDFDQGGLHILPVFIFVILYAAQFTNIKISPPAAFACTFISFLALDVPGAYIFRHFNAATVAVPGSAWEPLSLVGGDGFLDGLLISPVLAFCFALFVNWAADQPGLNGGPKKTAT